LLPRQCFRGPIFFFPGRAGARPIFFLALFLFGAWSSFFHDQSTPENFPQFPSLFTAGAFCSAMVGLFFRTSHSTLAANRGVGRPLNLLLFPCSLLIA